MNVAGNAADPPASAALRAAGTRAPEGQVRPVKYRTTIIEPDHRFMKRRVQPGLGFWAYQTAWRTVQGYEALKQLRKGQVPGPTKGEMRSQNRFLAAAFGLAAYSLASLSLSAQTPG